MLGFKRKGDFKKWFYAKKNVALKNVKEVSLQQCISVVFCKSVLWISKAGMTCGRGIFSVVNTLGNPRTEHQWAKTKIQFDRDKHHKCIHVRKLVT